MSMEQTEAYKTARRKALDFLKKSPNAQKFEEGIAILESVQYKPLFVRKIKEKGATLETREGLLTSIRSLIRQWATPDSPDHADELPSLPPTGTEVAEDKVERLSSSALDDPSNIGKVIRYFADLYKTRAKLHASLDEIGERNDDKSISQRKSIILSISSISDKMDSIWPLIDAWETKHEQPTDDETANALSLVHTSNSYASKADENNDANRSEVSSNDYMMLYSKMSREQLMLEKKNLAARIRRTYNKINYRAESIAGREKNPLPEGSPLRKKYEFRIQKLNVQLDELNQLIATFG